MDVKIKDREKEIEYVRLALAMCDFGISYKQAKLLKTVFEKLELDGGNFDLDTASKIHFEWVKWCEDYDKKEANKTLKDKFSDFCDKQQTLPAEFVDIVNEKFFDLI